MHRSAPLPCIFRESGHSDCGPPPNIYWSSVGSNAIRVANLDGTGTAQYLFSGEDFPRGIVIDPAANRIYWANPGPMPGNSGVIRVAGLRPPSQLMHTTR